MGKKAFDTHDTCCDKHQLDEEIQKLMTLLRKQNALLSGYYEKVTMELPGQKKKATRKSGPALKQEKTH